MAPDNIRFHFVQDGKQYDVDFLLTKENIPQAAKIDGRYYLVIGESDSVAKLRELIPSLQEGVSIDFLKKKLILNTPVSIAALSKMEAADHYLSFMEKEKKFRGVVLVKKGGKTLWFKAYGKADMDRMNTTSTRFCIGSVGKMFTATAILKLIQEGRFSLATKINELLPQKFQNPRWKELTVRHLLSHTSGIPSYGSFPEDEGRSSNFSLEELVALFKDKETAFEPGEMHDYSNSNYILLGAIIENNTGMSYEKYLQQTIFQPLKMTCTAMMDSYDETKDARGFILGPQGEEKTINKMAIHLSKSFSAGGGFVSTAEDLEKWDQALYDDNFLTPEIRNQMFSAKEMIVYDPEHFPYDKDEKGKSHPKKGFDYPHFLYGFGFSIDGNKKGKVFHPGGIVGNNSIFVHDATSKDCLIVLSNIELSSVPPEDNAFGIEQELETLIS